MGLKSQQIISDLKRPFLKKYILYLKAPEWVTFEAVLLIEIFQVLIKHFRGDR